MTIIKPRDYQEECYDLVTDYLKADNYKGAAIIEGATGCGKSVMIALDAKRLAGRTVKACRKYATGNQSRPFRVLVIQRQGEIAEQNFEACYDVGIKNSSLYSASLDRKSVFYPVIVGTEKSVLNALDEDFRSLPVDLILCDEAHHIDYESEDSAFMKIIRHFQRIRGDENASRKLEGLADFGEVRVLGFTGSPFRNNKSIIGKFWNRKLFSVDTDALIDRSYLTPLFFGYPSEHYDFGDALPDKETITGRDAEIVDAILDDELSKTEAICRDIIGQSQSLLGVVIFASTQKHTEQIAKCLISFGAKPEQVRIVTDKTSKADRREAMQAAKSGLCKYFINVGVASTGWNVPNWQACALLRPIGSVSLLIQIIGRVLRPIWPENAIMDTKETRAAAMAQSVKPCAYIWDYASVMERIGHLYNSEMLEDAEFERAKKENELITCPSCATENSQYARRCRGEDSSSKDGRCNFFWSFKECPHCGIQNDPSAQDCRECKGEMRSPDEKLLNTPYADQDYEPVTGWNIAPLKNGSIKVEYLLEAERKDGNPTVYLNPGSGSHGAKQAFKQWLSVNKESSGQGYGLHVLSRQSPEAAAKFVVKYWLNPMKPPTGIKFRVNGKGKFVIGRVTRE